MRIPGHSRLILLASLALAMGGPSLPPGAAERPLERTIETLVRPVQSAEGLAGTGRFVRSSVRHGGPSAFGQRVTKGPNPCD